MLQNIYIRNFALIDELKLKFDSGFTVITGETGAGKSIILGALGLLLGERADVSSIRNGEEKCIIEAEFTKSEQTDLFIEKNLLDNYHSLIIRREISKNRSSRSFINDTPVKLNLLKELAPLLIDINSQHQTIELQKGDFQLRILDSFSNNKALLEDYRKEYNIYKSKKDELQNLTDAQKKEKSDEDYLNFVCDELDKLNYNKGESEELEENLKIHSNAEAIKETLYSASAIISENDLSIISQLDELNSNFSNISKYSKNLEGLLERLESLKIELQDINSEIEIENDAVELNTEALQEVSDRLDEINRLMTKHSLNDADDLIAKRNEFQEKLLEISSFEKNINKLKSEINSLENSLYKKAEVISGRRNKNSKKLENEIVDILKILGMPSAKFILEVNTDKKLGINGIDKVVLRFSANKGHTAEDVSKVASGGELSRLMLSLKTILSKEDKNISLVFDEIDSGLSGKIAGKVGELLKEISNERQLITITHQAQIAAMGDYHFKVSKKQTSKTTISNIELLNKKERLEEISEMLGGEKSDSAKQTALDLLN